MKVLITGGSGLVGSRLIEIMIEKGFQINYVSRNPKQSENIKGYKWDIEKEEIDEEALDGVDAIIHLAGESVAAKKWSSNQKMKIISSRIDSARILREKVSKMDNKPKVYISASGVGYYGIDTEDQLMPEENPKGDGFLADVVDAWETGADLFSEQGMRVIKLRIGVVLASEGGALDKMLPPVKMGIGSPLGSGRQFMSWIHVDDLCQMIIHCLEKEETVGTYNAVSSSPVTNKEFTGCLAKTLNKPFFMPPVPKFVLKLMLGEMSNIVTGGNKVSNQKIKESGFDFHYDDLSLALDQILLKG